MVWTCPNMSYNLPWRFFPALSQVLCSFRRGRISLWESSCNHSILVSVEILSPSRIPRGEETYRQSVVKFCLMCVHMCVIKNTYVYICVYVPTLPENNIIGTYNICNIQDIQVYIQYIYISSELYKIKVKVPRSFLFAKLASLYVCYFPIPTKCLIFTTCPSQILGNSFAKVETATVTKPFALPMCTTVDIDDEQKRVVSR